MLLKNYFSGSSDTTSGEPAFLISGENSNLKSSAKPESVHISKKKTFIVIGALAAMFIASIPLMNRMVRNARAYPIAVAAIESNASLQERLGSPVKICGPMFVREFAGGLEIACTFYTRVRGARNSGVLLITFVDRGKDILLNADLYAGLRGEKIIQSSQLPADPPTQD
jgi:hypothetical protein